MTCKPLPIAAAVLACALIGLSGAARAQPLDLTLRPIGAAPTAPVARPVGAPAQAVPDLANLLDPMAPTKLQSKTLDTAVFAKTSVARHFANRDDLTGSFGFLCGLQPGHTESGVAAAYGTDPHGRFVGAKFSIAFK
jgi:hypothetical protein